VRLTAKLVLSILTLIVLNISFGLASVSAQRIVLITPTPPPSDFGSRNHWNDFSSERFKKYDKNYIQGEKIYVGKGPLPNYNFCVRNDEGSSKMAVMPISRKSLAAYRRTTITQFASAIVDCDAPEKSIFLKMKGQDAGLVVYYLNARYKLRLKQDKAA
jgi:hypothetical protein